MAEACLRGAPECIHMHTYTHKDICKCIIVCIWICIYIWVHLNMKISMFPMKISAYPCWDCNNHSCTSKVCTGPSVHPHPRPTLSVRCGAEHRAQHR
jgi:hypothetical protein